MSVCLCLSGVPCVRVCVRVYVCWRVRTSVFVCAYACQICTLLLCDCVCVFMNTCINAHVNTYEIVSRYVNIYDI